MVSHVMHRLPVTWTFGDHVVLSPGKKLQCLERSSSLPSADSFAMCCWPFVDVVLEEPPPPPPPPPAEPKKEYTLVSDQLNLVAVSEQLMY